MKREDLVKLIVISSLVAIAYIPTFTWMYERWVSAESYYSHGPLIPIIAIALVWLKRRELIAIRRRRHTNWAGAFLLQEFSSI